MLNRTANLRLIIFLIFFFPLLQLFITLFLNFINRFLFIQNYWTLYQFNVMLIYSFSKTHFPYYVLFIFV